MRCMYALRGSEVVEEHYAPKKGAILPPLGYLCGGANCPLFRVIGGKFPLRWGSKMGAEEGGITPNFRGKTGAKCPQFLSISPLLKY